jgi:hypothetical protein
VPRRPRASRKNVPERPRAPSTTNLPDRGRGSSKSNQRRRPPRELEDALPGARDGLTRLERVVLWQLREVQKETGREAVPAAMLYGRVVEHVDVSVDEFQAVLTRLVGRGL